MIKNIKFTDKVIKYNTKTQEGFEEILSIFDRKIRTMVYRWVGQIPNHDIDDLSQICKMKLVEALEKYNDTLNINFSTYVYTIWHRKLAQLRYQYKTKKYSRFIENDNYISFNYALDKNNNAFYLMLGKHKCPISKQVITRSTCRNCQYHVAYKTKEVGKGFDAGKKKQFTLCKYFMTVLEQRGVNAISLDAPVRGEDGNMDLINAIPNHENTEDICFKIDLENIKQKLYKKNSKTDRTAFIILQLMVEGFTRSEIIRKIDISSGEFNRCVKRLTDDADVHSLVQ
jgi:DNA-directed RNA polymerase specialized sigma subunit